ncbi:atrial natriuretic peptide receptor 2-like [Paramacrobiotus metropolitanus]|uniref:atrial natriuretic peptide receptor 2-like n=1 Tax=Paramacrobiotus metropolitanus TaxID=2943436 RepID=UPI002445C9A6|nr:atrial natriuretic peptide receptor 2-like [Paramacrobiotus metropolitanus]
MPTQDSDVYAFAIIIHQILMECEPFGADLPEKIADQRTGRPKLRKFDRAIRLASVAEGIRGSLVERIFIQLARYSIKLEHDVADRTLQLKSEKEEADQLLRKMLPQGIVKKLRNGLRVVPEYVESVSMYFNDMCGFGEFVTTVAPPDVATSGVVERIGDKHAQQICLASLEIQNSFDRLPNHRHMTLISGIHSGPVAVGVVGLKRPRYCLFGDTVNTASRMESHGEADMVHVSSDTVNLASSASGLLFKSRGDTNIKLMASLLLKWHHGGRV